jgi:hypothetical protein
MKYISMMFLLMIGVAGTFSLSLTALQEYYNPVPWFFGGTIIKTSVHQGMKKYVEKHPANKKSFFYNPRLLSQYALTAMYFLAAIGMEMMWPFLSMEEKGNGSREKIEWNQEIKSFICNIAINTLIEALPLDYYCYEKLKKKIPYFYAWAVNQVMYATLQTIAFNGASLLLDNTWQPTISGITF